MKTKRQEYTLKKCLSEIEKNYDFIIFDSPPNSECIKGKVFAHINYKKTNTHLKMYLPYSAILLKNQIDLRLMYLLTIVPFSSFTFMQTW